MKKPFIILLAMVLCLFMTSCGTSSTADEKQEIQSLDVVICDAFSGRGFGTFDYQALSAETGLNVSAKNFLHDEAVLKILAGDTDIDIYFFDATSVRILREQGIYIPIESEIVSEFVDGCFDYLQDYSYEGNNLVMMPICSAVSAVTVPKSTIAETEMTAADIDSSDEYLSFARNYNGDRVAYTNGSALFSFFEIQYNEYCCDFENKSFDYNTELYKSLYEKFLGGYLRHAQYPGAMEGFVHNVVNEGGDDSEYALMNLSLFDTNLSDRYFEEWRAFPVPRISEKVESNYVGARFAVINPYSNNKAAALKVLETIASDYYEYADYLADSSLLFREPSLYSESYHKDSDIFNDYFEIAKNGFISDYQVPSFHNDIDEYQNGRITLDEAIAMYQREVEIWLNE